MSPNECRRIQSGWSNATYTGYNIKHHIDRHQQLQCKRVTETRHFYFFRTLSIGMALAVKRGPTDQSVERLKVKVYIIGESFP